MTVDKKEYTIDHGDGRIEYIVETTTTSATVGGDSQVVTSESSSTVHTDEKKEFIGDGHEKLELVGTQEKVETRYENSEEEKYISGTSEKSIHNQLETVIDSKQVREQYDETGNHEYVQSKEEIRLVRRLDYIYVMPCIAAMNFLQFFDKSALNYATVLGIDTDTGVTRDQLAWLGSIFYLGYLIYQVPNAYFLQRVPIGRYVGSVIVIWGFVLAITCLATNFSQLAALRFLLGFFEAGIYPCCIMIISIMYRRREQAGRIGTVYICNGIAMSVGGLIGYGIGHLDMVHGLRGWKWIMIILGVVTIAFGFFCFFFLIDNPDSKHISSSDEVKAIITERILDNAVVRTKEIKTKHMIESLKEPRFYCFVLTSMFISFQNGALTSFSALITKSLGFDKFNSILLTIPAGVVDIIYIVIAIWVNRKYGHTLPTACILLLWSTIGLILLITIPAPKVKLLGLYMCWGFAAAYVLILTSLANNVTGYTKKIFYSSCMMVLYTIGNFVGPLMTMGQEAPFIGGMIGYCVANVICMALLSFAHYSMAKENRRRLACTTNKVVDINDDLTDVENTNIIYRL
ncbi:unnamed protein product [Cunninghamella echinulata]